MTGLHSVRINPTIFFCLKTQYEFNLPAYVLVVLIALGISLILMVRSVGHGIKVRDILSDIVLESRTLTCFILFLVVVGNGYGV